MKCLICSKQGQKVSNQTVRHILKPRCEGKIGEKEYYLCMNPECDVCYYNSEAVFYKSDLKVPLWYKKDANPKYACYCRKITQEEVTKTILETDLIDAEDIMFHLRGEVESNCRVNNPTGHCCHPVFNEMIEKALEIKSATAEKKSSQKPATNA